MTGEVSIHRRFSILSRFIPDWVVRKALAVPDSAPEAALRARIAALEAENALLREDRGNRLYEATFDQAAVGIAHVATDGSWLRVNRRLCAMLGYSEDELLTKTFQEITHPDDLDSDLDNIRRLLAGKITTYSMEKRYVRKDGDLLWIKLTVSLLRHT